jgi:hypothetical protein
MFKLNRHGMGMVEVLVAGAMAAIVSLGVATMMQNSMKESRRMIILDTLKNKKILFDNMLRDPNIWTATMNGNNTAPFTTLRSTSQTTAEISYASPVEFRMYNGDGTLAWDLLSPTDSGGPFTGFTEKGTVCSTFYTDSNGNDACPISYRLMVGVDCMYGTSCMNPQLKLVARLVFNPSSSGTLSSFTNFIMPVAGSSIADSIVDSKYDSVIKRTATTINRSFRLVSGFSPTDLGNILTNCQSALKGGAGRCTAAQSDHELQQAATSSGTGWWSANATHGGFDDNNLVTAVSSTFRFNEKGFYNCTISMPAFATNGFTGYLVDATSGTVAQASISAGKYSQSTVTIEAKFNVNDTSHLYKIQQKCEDQGSGTPDYRYCTLGIPATSGYTGVTYYSVVSINCFKVDRSM